jgi:hypothetical protein
MLTIKIQRLGLLIQIIKQIFTDSVDQEKCIPNMTMLQMVEDHILVFLEQFDLGEQKHYIIFHPRIIKWQMVNGLIRFMMMHLVIP